MKRKHHNEIGYLGRMTDGEYLRLWKKHPPRRKQKSFYELTDHQKELAKARHPDDYDEYMYNAISDDIVFSTKAEERNGK